MPTSRLHSSPWIPRKVRPYVLVIVLIILAALSLTEAVLSILDYSYALGVAQAVVEQAGATTPREKVRALRDYLRREVRTPDRPESLENRPFLRPSAADTLRSREGWSGEVTRAFIVMAEAVGVPAQRLNLYGKGDPHVVAEADLGAEGKVIVDCQQPPHIAELTPLDEVIPKLGFTDYSTLNLRRIGLGSFIPRLKLAMGPLTYWIERPHALKSAFWAALAVGIVAIKVLRSLLRRLLLRRGWIHASNRNQLGRLAQNPPAEQPGTPGTEEPPPERD